MTTLADNNTVQSEFPSDQAAILRDLARDGAPNEPSTYGYGNVASSGQSNGLSSSYPDLDDPAALLESLANFEHPASSNDTTANNSNQFASLLQAAATANGEEAAQNGRGKSVSVAASIISGQPSAAKTKRKRSSQDDHAASVPAKRHRPSARDEQAQLESEREIWGPDEPDGEDFPPRFEYEQSPNVVANARAVGVHSAAALFRRPSTASKKYTRPPMGKVFTSLELTPEQFLHIQSAAKNYMLDERYPERSDCVGNKGRGDNDMVKLKLFECVKSFLEDEGWGERCFGENSPGASQRRLKWPHSKTKLISLITPLLRRMVTNERQRRYAIESRKKKVEAAAEKDANGQPANGLGRARTATPQPSVRAQLQLPSASPFLEMDPKLNEYNYDDESPSPSRDGRSISRPPTAISITSLFPVQPPGTNGVKYLINIMENGHRIKPRFTLTPVTCPGFSSLIQHIHSVMEDGRDTRSVKVLGPTGLSDVSGEQDWKEAIEAIKQTEWMDLEVKCVVEMADK